MLFKSVLYLALSRLITGTVAAPQSGKAPNQEFLVDYTFETLATAPGVVNLQPIGEYNLLAFNGIVSAQQPILTGLRAHTKPNVAAFTGRSQILSGGQPAEITTSYTESALSYFQASSWYFGCIAATEEEALGVNVPCTITATGYAPNGNAVARQDFKFKTNGLPVQDLTFGKFAPSFNGLQRIVFEVNNNLTTAAVFDDFVATLYQNTANVIQ